MQYDIKTSSSPSRNNHNINDTEVRRLSAAVNGLICLRLNDAEHFTNALQECLTLTSRSDVDTHPNYSQSEEHSAVKVLSCGAASAWYILITQAQIQTPICPGLQQELSLSAVCVLLLCCVSSGL